ncbi:MAG: class I SAM-dependent methyltransferase [Xanthomonadales bacterium]|nr:class I SAM-dependent methyltransferase [Xanthomonadales bacterium]
MAFADHFSSQATQYAAARPHYPAALFDHLLDCVGPTAVVWEAACGSGQATTDLAQRFAQIHATEPSASALALAPPLPNVDYRVATAEAGGLPPASVDLVVVAQALHWFDQAAFFAEVERVLRPGGVLAVWCYQDVCLPPDLAPLYRIFAEQIDPHWPPQRLLIDQGYSQTHWPFSPLPVAPLRLQASWSLARLLEYCRSYSAVVRCLQATGSDPVESLAAALTPVWGEGERPIEWPLRIHLRRREGRTG